MSRSIIRSGVLALALSTILAACGEASADEPSPSLAPAEPTAPSQPAEPRDTPRPSPSPTPVATPVATPAPSEAPAAPEDPHMPNVVRHEVPMIGRVTADGVAVRELPDLDAPLVTGGSAEDEYDEFPNLRLDTGHRLVVEMGPVFADGLSWYYVRDGGTGPIHFLGWVAGEFLPRDGDYVDSLGTLDGLGRGGSLSVDVDAQSSVAVTLGVNVVDGDSACHFVADIILADGTIAPISDGDVTGPMFGRAGAPDAAGLVQPVDGTMTLRVATDCSFAASLGLMGH